MKRLLVFLFFVAICTGIVQGEEFYAKLRNTSSGGPVTNWQVDFYYNSVLVDTQFTDTEGTAVPVWEHDMNPFDKWKTFADEDAPANVWTTPADGWVVTYMTTPVHYHVYCVGQG